MKITQKKSIFLVFLCTNSFIKAVRDGEIKLEIDNEDAAKQEYKECVLPIFIL